MKNDKHEYIRFDENQFISVLIKWKAPYGPDQLRHIKKTL